MTKIRMAVVSAALALSVTAVAAQRMFADFSGKWNVAIDAQGQSMQSLMTVTQKGDSVSGTTESQIGTANFDGVVKGDSIFFGFAIRSRRPFSQSARVSPPGTLKSFA